MPNYNRKAWSKFIRSGDLALVFVKHDCFLFFFFVLVFVFSVQAAGKSNQYWFA